MTGLGNVLRAGGAIGRALLASTGPRRRRSALPVVMAAIGALGGAAIAMAADAPSALGGSDRARIEAVVRDYILTHPDIIPEAMERLRDQEAAKSIAAHRAEIETPYAGAWAGARDGDVTLVEFFDYSCGFCRAAVADVDRLLVEDKRLKIVYRELPILGEDSVQAARVGLLAADSGKYAPFHAAMYGHQSVDKASIVAAATKAGLDRGAVGGILASRGSADEFTRNIALAQDLGARGTPLFVVGDRILHGDVGYDALKEAVDAARKKRAPAG